MAQGFSLWMVFLRVLEQRMAAMLFDVLKTLAKSWTASLTWAFIFFLRRAAVL